MGNELLSETQANQYFEAYFHAVTVRDLALPTNLVADSTELCYPSHEPICDPGDIIK